MHELAITENILQIAVQHAHQAGGHPITDLYLVIGDLSTVVDDSIQFYWDIISAGTLAEGATLRFRRIAAEILCLACRWQGRLPDDLSCPSCGSYEIQVTAGEEFYLEAIDVDVPA